MIRKLFRPGLVPIVTASILGPTVLPAPASEYAEGEVLVAFRAEAGSFRREKILEEIGARLEAARPALGYEKLVLESAVSVEAAVRRLESHSDVLWVEPNWTYHVASPAAPRCPQDEYLRRLPASPNQWGIFDAGIEGMWKWGGGGDPGVTIAIIDSGVDDFAAPHPDLNANTLNGVNQGRDFVDGDFTPTDAGAFRGHGTGVAGVAAADADSLGTAGVAFCSSLMFVRVMDCASAQCPGDVDDIAQGITWAADNGAKVVNLSLSGNEYSQAMRNAIIHAIEQGCIVIAASGNDGAAEIGYPARYPEVISVGATDSTGDVASFSNHSPQLDVVAPGDDVWVPDVGDTWSMVDGTSVAAPLVSGIAALLAARNPAIKHLEVREWLHEHAVPTPSPSRDGAGRVYYQNLADFGDHESFPPAGHENSMWEWLGGSVTAELGDTDPNDTDGVPNVDPFNPNSADLGDDNFLPNLGSPPWAPARWAPGKTFEITMAVSDHDGPRYGPAAANSIHLDQWFDWNGNGTFESSPSPEHSIVDHTENPRTWAGNAKAVMFPVSAPTEHVLGNPLHIRTRLNYGGPNPPDGMLPFGEVEDYRLIHLIEDFDTVFYTIDPLPFVALFGTWMVVPDPQPEWSHHGAWDLARCEHPRMFEDCTGVIEHVEEMVTPPMDWNEYTHASVNFAYNHNVVQCGPVAADFCRVEIRKDGAPAGSSPIPMGVGSLTIDLSAHTGGPEMITIHWICDTDDQGWLMVDDVRVVAIDDEKPTAIPDLAAARTTGSRDVTVSFSAPVENEVALLTKEPLASAYEFRYSPDPILNDVDFGLAVPILPREATGGSLPTPAGPGTPQMLTFAVPSAHQTYHFAVKSGDEINHTSLLSNVPSVVNAPVVALAVTAPAGTTMVASGDSVTVDFTVANTGSADDLIRLSLTSAVQGWDHWFVEGGAPVGSDITVELAGGANTVVTAGVLAPGGAAATETLRLTASSTCDPAVSAFDDALVTKDADATSVPGLGLPVVAALDLAGPNPFHGSTAFRFALPSPQTAQLALYDVTGRRVRTFLNGPVEAGYHRIEWDGRNDGGRHVPSGIYFLKGFTEGLSSTKRIVRLR